MQKDQYRPADWFPHRDLLQPIYWTTPRRITVRIFDDLWNPRKDHSFIAAVLAVPRLAPQHEYVFLTEHAERMLQFFGDKDAPHMGGYWRSTWCFDGFAKWSPEFTPAEHLMMSQGMFQHARDEAGLEGPPPYPYCEPMPNVWIGVKVDSQDAWDERVQLLRRAHVSKRWVMCVPPYEPDLVVMAWQ